LPIVERTLVNLRRVIGTIPLENRWYPVIQRYLSQVAGRVKAFGGEGDGREERTRFEGKVAGICFDRFGDFKGFWLDTEDGKRSFRSREKAVEELVREAWAERIAIIVIVEREDSHEPLSIVLLRPPRIFEPELVVNRPSRAAISRQASLRGECDNMPNAIVSLKLARPRLRPRDAD
jgi:hypothetical protein